MTEKWLRAVRKNRWCDGPPWLKADEVQADALIDLQCKDNKLSFYLVDDSDERQVSRVVTALAAGRQSVTAFDYTLIDSDFCEKCDIEVEQTSGTTADDYVNKLHRDFIQLTSVKVGNLASKIRENQQVIRKLPSEVKSLITEAMKENRLELDKVNLSDKASFLENS